MRILVLGGDGFCGWPISLHLSEHGHDVTIIDNLSRRRRVFSVGADSLTPIRDIDVRIDRWRALTSKRILYHTFDIAKYSTALNILLEREGYDAIIHLAEQPSAAYSMQEAGAKVTIVDNVETTSAVLIALAKMHKPVPLVHIGTMGVYGYGALGGSKIPEGYFTVTFPDGQKQEILYPTKPGSIYHMTKCLDQTMFEYFARNYGLQITDLHQGVVWGTQTPQTEMHEDLINRYDYDECFGTVLNRFVLQAVIRHKLSVYGSGGQTRGFINLQNTVECVRLAVENPPPPNHKVRIFNQLGEVARVRDLAEMVATITGTGFTNIENPRNEAPENTLDAANDSLLCLGMQPILLRNGLPREIFEVAERYKHRCKVSAIMPKTSWTRLV